MKTPGKSGMAAFSRGLLFPIISGVACMILASCRVAEEPASPDGVFTKTEVATFNAFRSADTAERVVQGEQVVAALQAAMKRPGTKGRITQEQVRRLMGEPSETRVDGSQARLLYRVSRKGGASKLLALVWMNDVFVITEPVWTVE